MTLKIYIIGILLAISSISDIYANNIFEDDKKKKIASLSSLPLRYRSLGIKFGPRTINTDPGQLTATYKDNSPIPNYFVSTKNLKNMYYFTGMQIDYSWRKYSGLSHSIFVDINLAKYSGGFFAYSIGWSIPVEINSRALVIRPNLSFGFGNYGIYLGQIKSSNGSFIIGNKTINDQYLDVAIESQVTLCSPQLDFRFTLTANIHFTAQLSYDIVTENEVGNLEFTSQSSGFTSLPIKNNNPSLDFNNMSRTTLPYSGNSLRISVGAAYTLNIYE